MAAEDKLIAHVLTDGSPDEQVRAMAGCRVRPGPAGMLALGCGFAFLFLPALIVYDIVSPPVFAVITNRRLVLVRGNARTGFLWRREAIDLDQVEKVEVQKGWYDQWALHLRGGKVLRLSEISKKGGWGVTNPTAARFQAEGPALLQA